MAKRSDIRKKLLLVDDNELFLEGAVTVLSRDFDCACVAEPGAVLKVCDSEDPDAVLLDLYFEGKPKGFDILTEILNEHPFLPVIMWTESEAMDEELKAQDLGAFHYIRKDARPDDVVVVVDAALRRRQILISDEELRVGDDRRWGKFIYCSDAMARIFSSLPKMASSNCAVLITGETGVGKGLLAREIHRRSSRAGGPFKVVECASLPDTIVENELFGHERGAYTGAVSQQIGSCEAAHNGTLFLDEIGDMPIVSQAKLLRLADEGKFKRLGGKHDKSVDVRIVAATNRHLADDVGAGTFRKDLFYRLNTFHIEIPPLRQRRDDIVLLAKHFAAEYGSEPGAGFALSSGAELYLQAQDWDGNVRELKHTVERACVLAETSVLSPQDLAARPSGKSLPLKYKDAEAQVVADLKRTMVSEALGRNDGNITKAAKELGIARQTFHSYLEEMNLGEQKK